MIDLRLGDCCEFEDAGLFHALLCDPPYELNFMGCKWDASGVSFQPETWAKLAEHLYDGAFGMAFASSRGWHRLACAIEDAGLIIHPTIFGYSFGSGFPKATRIDSQIDKAAGAERKVIGEKSNGQGRTNINNAKAGYRPNPYSDGDDYKVTAPATPLAATWAGHRYGLQALKPALEPIIVFQKPYRGKPIECITRTGAGALNIDRARIGYLPDDDAYEKGIARAEQPRADIRGGNFHAGPDWAETKRVVPSGMKSEGRWPANFILLDEDAAQALDAQSGESKSSGGINGGKLGTRIYGHFANETIGSNAGGLGDSGGASRFFYRVQEQIDDADPVYYTAKASRCERDAGLDGYEEKRTSKWRNTHNSMPLTGSVNPRQEKGRNPHPTVKPIALARYLATLLLPPAEYAPRRLLVPFAGVGSEMIGAMLAGWEDVTGIERGAEYVEIGQARIAHWCGIPTEAQAQMTMPMVTV